MPGDRDATRQDGEQSTEPIRYPTNHVVAVLDTPEQLTAAVEALTGGGFLPSEIHVSTGAAAAERLSASSGRTGLAGLAVRIAERLGIEDSEMELKSRYEQALREGRYVLQVLAPTEERKDRATQILGEHGAHGISFFAQYTIERVIPPTAS